MTNKFVLFMKTALIDPFLRSFSRFTEAVVVSLIIIVLQITSNETQLRQIFNPILKSLWLLLSLMLLMTLIVARFKLKTWHRYALMGLSVIGALVYYFVGPLEGSRYIENFRFAALLGIISVLALCVAYFPRRQNFSIYVMYLATKLFATLFYAGVLYGSLVAIFVAMESLFNIDFGTYIYLNLLIIIANLVAIPIFLGFIPMQDQELTIDDYHKIWKTVFSLIIVPVVTVFTMILLIYIITSSFNQNYYPEVFVIATIVVGGGGFAALIALDPFIKDTPHLTIYAKYWPYVFAPVMIGYIVEVIRQIITDGFIMMHMTSVYLGIWLIAVLIINIIKRPLFKMSRGQIFFLSGADTLFLIMFFPFINVINIATYQYNAEFKAILTSNNMLVDNQIVPRDDLTLSEKEAIVRLIIKADEIGVHRLKYLPDNYTYLDFETVFGFPFFYIGGGEQEYQFVNYQLDTIAIDLNSFSTFDFLYDITPLPLESGSDLLLSITVTGSIYQLTNDNIDITFDMYDVAAYFYDNVERGKEGYTLTEMTYTGSNNGFDFTLYLRYINGYLYKESERFTVSSAAFILGVNTI